MSKQNNFYVESPSLIDRLSDEQKEVLNELPINEKAKFLTEALDQSESAILSKLASDNGIQFVKTFKLVKNPSERIPLKLIHEYQCLPVEPHSAEAGDERLHLVTVWPITEQINEWVRVACGEEPVWHLAYPQEIEDTIIHHFGVGSGSLDESELIDEGEDARNLDEEENEDAAIIRFVNEIISRAINDRATDIHFEPQKKSLQIRYRIDGQLVQVKLPENLVKIQSAIISRLKIMAKLNISEKRRPQDGRIRFLAGPIELDIRLSTLPTMYGESISLRLLNHGNRPLTVEDLGMPASDLKTIDENIHKPHGIILVTGPTGSGKSTSLSSFVRRIRTPERRIMTVEDPVEYEIEGVNQSQVHGEIGFSFASALRHILRQDPDVIMIGEIRDRETADIAIRASMTGHLVLSSLHTNDAAGAITRLVDMGIEPFLVASSVEMIIAQRLVRRLCVTCAESYEVSAEALAFYLNKFGLEDSVKQLKRAKGCEDCRGLGYRGRIGIFEILKLSDSIHSAIVKKASAREIREIGIKEGLHTLQQSAWDHVKKGITSLDAIMSFAISSGADDDFE